MSPAIILSHERFKREITIEQKEFGFDASPISFWGRAEAIARPVLPLAGMSV